MSVEMLLLMTGTLILMLKAFSAWRLAPVRLRIRSHHEETQNRRF